MSRNDKLIDLRVRKNYRFSPKRVCHRFSHSNTNRRPSIISEVLRAKHIRQEYEIYITKECFDILLANMETIIDIPEDAERLQTSVALHHLLTDILSQPPRRDPDHPLVHWCAGEPLQFPVLSMTVTAYRFTKFF